MSFLYITRIKRPQVNKADWRAEMTSAAAPVVEDMSWASRYNRPAPPAVTPAQISRWHSAFSPQQLPREVEWVLQRSTVPPAPPPPKNLAPWSPSMLAAIAATDNIEWFFRRQGGTAPQIKITNLAPWQPPMLAVLPAVDHIEWFFRRQGGASLSPKTLNFAPWQPPMLDAGPAPTVLDDHYRGFIVNVGRLMRVG